MTDKLVVFVACEDKKEAEEIAAKIVSEHLAACVNVISGVQSCYIWEGKLTWSKEVLLLVKTSRERFRELETRLRAIHSYVIPEVVAVPIVDGSEDYLNWVQAGVQVITAE